MEIFVDLKKLARVRDLFIRVNLAVGEVLWHLLLLLQLYSLRHYQEGWEGSTDVLSFAKECFVTEGASLEEDIDLRDLWQVPDKKVPAKEALLWVDRRHGVDELSFIATSAVEAIFLILSVVLLVLVVLFL